MSNRPRNSRRVKRQHDSDSDSSVASTGGADSEDGTTPRLQPRPSASSSSHHHQAPNAGYFPHRHFAVHQLPSGSQSQHQDAVGLHVFATADGTEYRPESNEPVGQGPGGEWACSSAEADAGLALAGAPGRLSQQDAAAFQDALQGLGQPEGGAAGQAGLGSQHQAIRGAFPTHHAFPRHDASTGHQPLQHRLGQGAHHHQPVPPPPPQVFQQSGTFQLEHNHNHHHQYHHHHHHDVLATPPADVVAPPYPPHPPAQSSLFHHHQQHQPQHSSGAVDPPPTDPRPHHPSPPAPTAVPNHDHDPLGLLCHPHDPRLAHLQPHHSQPQHHPPHHAHHQNIVAHAAGYFPPNAVDQQPALPLDDFHAGPPRYFFPTPLDHPDHPQHPPIAPGEALALVPYHDADQINNFYEQLPSNWPLAQGPGGLWSPMMQEMSILNAESYNDGTSSFRPPRSLSDLKNTGPARVSPPSRKRSKDTLKRTKDETADQGPKDSEEPPRKRGRGRPKLSNSEESPAERRRVQIRLAQRNYRSRKERNVVILEQKIKDLDRVAADMSQAFTQLHDFALARGMLESDPEFGRRLQATTQTFLTLARRSHEIVTAEIVDVDKQQGASGEQPDANATPAVSATSPGMSPEKKTAGNNSAGARPSSGDQQVLMAGLIVTHEPVMDYTEAVAPSPPSTSATHAPPGSWSRNDPSPSASSSHHHPAASAKTYEVVSHPTVHNASFPFGMSLENPETTAMPTTTTTTTTSANPHHFPFHVDFDASGFVDPSRTIVPDPYPPSFFSQFSPAAGLNPSLPPPSSFAYLERTFGRRLQRTALERGLRLLHMPDPPPHFFAAVFGFCLLFESRESIIKRMTDCTSVNEKETLSNWRFPFLQLGGAGTFFPELNEMDDPGMALNLQDAILGPGNLGFGVSSMASTAAAAAEGDEYQQQQQQQQPEKAPHIGNRGLLEPHRSKIAPDSMFGQGPWTPEIESTRDLRVDRKLRIVVPGWEGDFYDCDEVEWYLQQRGVVIPAAADFVTAEIDQDDFLGGQKAGPIKAFDATIDNFINDWLMKDFVSDGGTGGAVAAQLATPSASADTPIGDSDLARAENLLATRDGEPVTDKGKARHKAPAVPQVNTFTGGIPPVATPGKRLVTINVNTLVDELVARSVCLGRTPGVRPKDVDGAFWSSVTLV